MKKIFLLTLIQFFAITLFAQDYTKLDSLKQKKFSVYFSKGYEKRAASISIRVQHAMDYFEKLFNTKAEINLLVLAENDWATYSSSPVMGMPHYKNSKELVVAAHDNEMWRSFIPPTDKIPEDLAADIKKYYISDEGNLSMQPFFDLLAIHELGHAFHMQAGINVQRKWMGELLVNMMLHSFIEQNEPQSLGALTVFPNMVVAAGTEGFQFTKLNDVHEKYDEIGKYHPRNYGWYQSRWHKAAADMYKVSGLSAVMNAWNALRNQKETLSDEELINYLEKAKATDIVNMIRNW